MSQSVGYQYKSRIPTFSDDASIVEALRVYHYGVDNYTTQSIPDDSIEGNFRSLNQDVATLTSAISALGSTYVEQVSLSASPNIITAQTTTTIPITVRAISSQTSSLQQWQNSSSASVGGIGVGGNINLAGYATIGSTTQSTTTGVNVVIGNAAHKGIVVKAQSSQTANIQEWQSNAGTAISYVDKDGKMFSESAQVFTTASSIPISSISPEPSKKHLEIREILSQVTSTLVLLDDGKMIEANSSSSNVIIVPFNSGVAFPIGTAIVITQTGSGQTMIEGNSNISGGLVTVNGTPGLKLRTQWSLATLIKRDTDVWVLAGDVVA